MSRMPLAFRKRGSPASPASACTATSPSRACKDAVPLLLFELPATTTVARSRAARVFTVVAWGGDAMRSTMHRISSLRSAWSPILHAALNCMLSTHQSTRNHAPSPPPVAARCLSSQSLRPALSPSAVRLTAPTSLPSAAAPHLAGSLPGDQDEGEGEEGVDGCDALLLPAALTGGGRGCTKRARDHTTSHSPTRA